MRTGAGAAALGPLGRPHIIALSTVINNAVVFGTLPGETATSLFVCSNDHKVRVLTVPDLKDVAVLPAPAAVNYGTHRVAARCGRRARAEGARLTERLVCGLMGPGAHAPVVNVGVATHSGHHPR